MKRKTANRAEVYVQHQEGFWNVTLYIICTDFCLSELRTSDLPKFNAKEGRRGETEAQHKTHTQHCSSNRFLHGMEHKLGVILGAAARGSRVFLYCLIDVSFHFYKFV